MRLDPARHPRQDVLPKRREHVIRKGWNQRPPRILVIEDNPDSAEMLVFLLQAMGFEAQAEFDVRSGMRAAWNWKPTLVLSDIDLPDGTGFDIADRLSHDPAFRHTPLVALTGRHDERDNVIGQRAGFDRYLHKPIDPEYLRGVLCELLDRRRGDDGRFQGSDRRGH